MTLSAPGVATSGIGRRLRFNRRSAAVCTGSVLDFNVNITVEHANGDSVDGGPRIEPILEQICDVTRKDLLIPPGESSSGGASSVKTLPAETLSETSLPSSAPDPISAGDQAAPAPSLAPSEAAARRTTYPAPRSKPALTRARAAVYCRADKPTSTPPAWRFFSINVHCITCSYSLCTPTERRRTLVTTSRMRRSSQSTLASPLPPSETIRGGGGQTEGPEHFQGCYKPTPSGTMKGGGRQGDRQPQEARRLRAGTCGLRPCWTKGG